MTAIGDALKKAGISSACNITPDEKTDSHKRELPFPTVL